MPEGYDDLSLCPGKSCGERYAHKHCAAFGCILLAEGGGGDDGSKVAGYAAPDGGGVTVCVDCGLEVCERCVSRKPYNDGPRCYDCYSVKLLGIHARTIAATTHDNTLLRDAYETWYSASVILRESIARCDDRIALAHAEDTVKEAFEQMQSRLVEISRRLRHENAA